MTRFEFPLDRLLAVKRQLERRAEADQAKAQRELLSAKEVIIRIREQQNAVATRLAETANRIVSPAEWAASHGQIAHYEIAIEKQNEVVSKAELNYAEAAAKRAQLAKEVEALTTLRQQRWEEWKQEAAKQDQERLDEMGARRWIASRANGPEIEVTP